MVEGARRKRVPCRTPPPPRLRRGPPPRAGEDFMSEAPITPAGYAAMRQRYEQLFMVERPKMVETVSWAAGNGDRSENGDYIYGRKRLREIDRELTHLSRRMKAVRIVDPTQQ